MAMIVDAFVGKCVEALLDLAKSEVVMVLGVKKDLQRLQDQMEFIRDVLFDAERRRIDDRAVRNWLSKLKDVLYDADDIIDLCRINGGHQLLLDGEQQLPSASSSASLVKTRFRGLFPRCLEPITEYGFRHEIGLKIKEVTSRLEEISKYGEQLNLVHSIPVVQVVTQVNRRQTSSLPPPVVVGEKMEEATNELVGLLKEGNQNIRVLAVVGTGGIGKTTLAQNIFNQQSLQVIFEVKIWACVSQNYSETELLKELIRGAGGHHANLQSKDELHRSLRSAVSGKRFLLVLDDVWRADVWEDLLSSPLQNGGPGSKILVTTRNINVAKSMRAFHTHQVDKLSLPDGWRLLSSSVFENEAEADMQGLRDIGKKIVEKCDCLPLAIKVIGGVLRTKGRSKREWEKVYSSHAWNRGDLNEEVKAALYLSYEDLPSPLKQCFLLLSLFPEDYRFERDELVRLWVSEGFVTKKEGVPLEETAEDYFYEFINRNLLHRYYPAIPRQFLFQDQTIMHDMVRSLAIFLAHRENCFVEVGGPSADTLCKVRRLGIAPKIDAAPVLNAIENQKRLRTLICPWQRYVNMEDLFNNFRHLRVLDLFGISIDLIPSSIKNLQHLRYLDISKTYIRELPESIGCLSLLLILNLSDCSSLHALPMSITQLSNLRCLNVWGTPLSHIPAGLGKLEHLNDLQGFVVGDDDDDDGQELQHQQHACSLNELQSLSQIRCIQIEKLERALTTSGSNRPLEDKAHLKELRLICTSWVTVEDSMRIEMVFENLCPSPALDKLTILNFYGVKFPGWMAMLPNLTDLYLFDCFDNCTQLPALGHLPQLRVLHINGARAVTSIGVECLLGCQDGTAFPKLEELTLTKMKNLEEWTWDIVTAAGASINSISQLLPRLTKLSIQDCPKLRALPDGLRHASSLKELTISDADSLIEVDSLLPSLEELSVINCNSLVRISNLPAIKKLLIGDSCRSLESIENLNTLQWLCLDDNKIKRLPECLLELIQKSVSDNGKLRSFILSCNQYLGEKCGEGGQYWSLLQHIQDCQVHVTMCGRGLLYLPTVAANR